MKQVKTDTQNRVSMGPGTLYGSLARMLESGLIEERAPKSGFAQESERRIYYGLTGLGQSMLTAELERYREVVAVAESQQILSPGAYCEA